MKPAHVHARHARAVRAGSRAAALGSLQPICLDWPGDPRRGSRTGDRCSRPGEVKTRHKMTSTFKKNKRALIAGWGSGTTGRGPLGAMRFKRSTAREARACLTGKTTGKKKPAPRRAYSIDRSVSTLESSRRRLRRNARPSSVRNCGHRPITCPQNKNRSLPN